MIEVVGGANPMRHDWELICRHNYPAERILELEGKDLACWCPLDQPCHADVLLELANNQSRKAR